MSTPSAPFLSPLQLIRAQSTQWRQIVKQALTDARVASPAIATSDMDPATQTVSVQIAIQEKSQGPTGLITDETIIPIKMVPVAIPRAGGFAVTLPVKQGDEGLLIFCDACFDLWWQSGGVQKQNEVRRHHVHDCGFFPGMCSQPNVLADYSTDSLQVRSEDGSVVVDVSDDGVVTTVGSTKLAVSNDEVQATASSVVAANGGTAQALVTDAFYQWFVANVLPYLKTLTPPYSGPNPPGNSETTILKGQ
jgi:hypothetical protein